MIKLPGYVIEFQITLDGIKRYTGWGDEEVAKRLNITARTLRSIRKDPASAKGITILQAQHMLKELRRKNDVL